MEYYIQAIYSPLILIFGLSHIAQPRLTADFFIAMKQTGFAPLIIGMYTLPTGLILIVGHNKWVLDWPLFITLSGWGMTLKSVVYLLFPHAFDRLIADPERFLEKSYRRFRVIGLVMVVFGGILTWQVASGAIARYLGHKVERQRSLGRISQADSRISGRLPVRGRPPGSLPHTLLRSSRRTPFPGARHGGQTARVGQHGIDQTATHHNQSILCATQDY